MNTATVSIQIEGQRWEYMFEKVRIHISEIIPQEYFPVFAQVRIQAPHVFTQKLIPQEFFPACIGFVPGGTENYYIINSETIMDVNNYIPFSIINSQTIGVM